MVEARVDLALKLLKVSQAYSVGLSQGKGHLLLGLGHIRLVCSDSLADFSCFLLVNKSVPALWFRNGPNHMVLR